MAHKVHRMGTRSDDGRVVLSYEDCLLRKGDVDLLEGPYWLNDAIIGFYFTYLEKSANKSENTESIKFFSPELTQFVKMVKSISECSTMLDCVITKDTQFIFFPLNDCQKYDDAGGTHWSLLIYSKPEDVFCHFDSMNGYNQTMAKAFADGVNKYLIANNFKVRTNRNNTMSVNFKDIECPQQSNNYDCGVFVLTYAEVILQNIKLNLKIEGYNVSNVSNLVTSQRSKLLKLIKDLKNSGS